MMPSPAASSSRASANCKRVREALAELCIVKRRNQPLDLHRANEMVLQHRADESDVLRACRVKLRDGEIARIDAPASRAAGVFIAHRRETRLPALRQQRCVRPHAVGEVTVGFAEADTLSPPALIRSPTVSRDPAKKANA